MSSKQKSHQPWLLVLSVILTLFIVVPTFQVSAASVWQQSAQDFAGQWPAVEDLEGTGWLVLDTTTGDVLIENNSQARAWPASTTKIMTAVLALESGLLDQTVTVSEAAVDLPAGSSLVGFLAGEEVLVRDVLGGLMTASGNDAANILAEAIAGSQTAFADQMNGKAAELGLDGTHFTNASGLHEDLHYTTAADMANLAAYAMSNDQFAALAALKTYTMPPTNLHPFAGWGLFKTTNSLMILGSGTLQSDLIDQFTGIKTGTTPYAGSNLVSAATTATGHDLVAVLFGVPTDSQKGNAFIYSRTLLLAAAQLIEDNLPSPTPTMTPTPAVSETSAPVPTPTPTLEDRDSQSSIAAFFKANPWRSAFLIASGLLVIALMFYGRLALRVRQTGNRKPKP